jgi:predicted outer membrane repeat protein
MWHYPLSIVLGVRDSHVTGHESVNRPCDGHHGKCSWHTLPLIVSATTILLLQADIFQKSQVSFVNNRAEVAGAAIYASDLSRCRWLGELPGDHTIFEIPPDKAGAPFLFVNNTLMGTGSGLRGNIVNETLATSPSNIISRSKVSLQATGVGLSAAGHRGWG